jgi:hypothetical protein
VIVNTKGGHTSRNKMVGTLHNGELQNLYSPIRYITFNNNKRKHGAKNFFYGIIINIAEYFSDYSKNQAVTEISLNRVLCVKKDILELEFVTEFRYHVSAVKLYAFYQRNADIIFIVIIVRTRNFSTYQVMMLYIL